MSNEAEAFDRVLLDIAVAVRKKQHKCLDYICLHKLHFEAVLFCKEDGRDQIDVIRLCSKIPRLPAKWETMKDVLSIDTSSSKITFKTQLI